MREFLNRVGEQRNIRTYSQQLVMTNAHAKTGCDKFAC